MIEYDILGQICPSSLLFALKEMNTHQEGLREGKVSLRFRTDNRDCVSTIPQSARHMGFGAQVSRVKGYYLIEITRN